MKKKILIIGFGNMGYSHFKSFEKKDFIIHLLEKKNNEKIKIIKKDKFFKKKYFILENIPKKKNYFLTICATQSKERFKIINKFLSYNKTNYLLMEKFCFLKLKEFEQYYKKFNINTKTFINSWGYILAKKTNLKKKLSNFKLTCHVKEGNFLANITHIFHFFSYLNNKVQIKKFSKFDFEIIKNEKRKKYDELKTKLNIKDENKNLLSIQTKKKMNNLITFDIKQTKPKINFKVLIKNDNTIWYYKTRKIVNNIKFPYSSKTTFIFLKNCTKGNFSYMPSFKNDYNISKIILKNLNVKIP